MGGSGHLAYVDYVIDEVRPPRRVETGGGEGWEFSYCYTISITGEFTFWLDNPPREYKYRETLIVDDVGRIIGEKPKELV